MEAEGECSVSEQRRRNRKMRQGVAELPRRRLGPVHVL